MAGRISSLSFRNVSVALVVIVIGLGLWLYERSRWNQLVVTATAYNSVPEQTTAANPDVAAWGDRLEPGMRVIAVSRDLERLGLGRGTCVRIEGLPGEWTVLDRMHRRWTNKIDLYMGNDIEAARRWGKRSVTIRWRSERDPK